MNDEIITELWAIKGAIAREHNYDLDALFRYFESTKPVSTTPRAG